MKDFDFLNEELDDDDAACVMTEAAILCETLKDWEINMGNWNDKIWNAIVEDFTAGMVRSEHMGKAEERERLL